MNGAQALMQTLSDSGVEVCFANPGTSEMQLVAALDQQQGMRAVLGLFGQAIRYARARGPTGCSDKTQPAFGERIFYLRLKTQPRYNGGDQTGTVTNPF